MNLLDGLVLRKDLAAALGVCTRTIARYETRADGLPYLSIGGRRYYRVASVQAWISAQERRPNPRRQRKAA